MVLTDLDGKLLGWWCMIYLQLFFDHKNFISAADKNADFSAKLEMCFSICLEGRQAKEKSFSFYAEDLSVSFKYSHSLNDVKMLETCNKGILVEISSRVLIEWYESLGKFWFFFWAETLRSFFSFFYKSNSLFSYLQAVFWNKKYNNIEAKRKKSLNLAEA